MTCYVVDSSAFIDAAAEWYPRDVFPTIWEILEEFGQQGVVVSIDAVQDELLKRQDDLARWAKDKFPGWRPAKYNPKVIEQYAIVAQYVQGHPDKSPEGKAAFLKGADGWLVAWAIVHHAAVVAHETLPGPGSKKIKIPDVCTNFGVQCVRLIEMLRQLGVHI